MAVAGNQQPVVVVHTDLITGKVITESVQPLVGINGGDGTRPTVAGKLADNAWTPFKNLNDTSSFVAAPATRLSTAADDTAVIAAGLAKI